MEVVRNRSDKLLAQAPTSALRTILSRIGYPVPRHLDRGLVARKGYVQGAYLAGRRVAVSGPVPGWGAEVASAALQSQQANTAEGGDALVLDATGIDSLEAAEALFSHAQDTLCAAAPHTRTVILGNATTTTPFASALQEGLQGFVRSAAKEVGGRGCTVNLLNLGPALDPAAALAGPLSFLLRPQAAFITGQDLTVGGGVALPVGAGSSGVPTFTPLPPAVPLAPTHTTSRKLSAGAEVGETDTILTASPLRGKVALVTGAARGIGAEVAAHLAASGATVLAMDLPALELQLRQTVEGLPGYGGLTHTGDITSPDSRGELIDTIKALYGGVDIIVHNAGVTADRTLKRMKPSQIHKVLAVNLGAIAALDSELGITPAGVAGAVGSSTTPPPPGSAPPAPHCLLRPGGRLVYMSSINGVAGAFGQTNYAYTKSALMGYVASLGPLLAPYGATANAVAPGFIDTDMTASLPLLTSEVGRRANAMSQGGLPFDIAAAVTAFTLPESAGVSGQTLRVCGGHATGR